ncbi:MAG: hypothetical protein L0211_11085 [Planctomycetaceae bacterium]|nr:hypothetical protein [Planctomycetaceae bacterium]
MKFPVTFLHEQEAEGMALRDWFAGQALAGVFANANFLQAVLEGGTPQNRMSILASSVFEIADAMLKEREKPKQ